MISQVERMVQNGSILELNIALHLLHPWIALKLIIIITIQPFNCVTFPIK